MRTIAEVVEDIISILNNIERTEECYGETLVDINELAGEILTINSVANESVNGDLISRSEVIKALSIFNDRENGNKHFIFGIQTAKEIVENQPTAYNDGWTPCSQRLPEESGEYYTYVYYDGHYMYSIDEIDCDGMVKEWNCSSDYKIIAWKPIVPYQPKGE